MFKVYAAHHQTFFNKMMHAAGVPLILLSVQIFLGPFAWPFLLTLLLIYGWLNWRLAIITGMFLFCLTFVAQFMTGYLTLFVSGWTLLFVGHYVEGRSPALFSNIFQSLVAPIFLTAELCQLFGFTISE